MTALVDTGVLFAAIDADDDYHDVSRLALEEEPAPLLPDVVLPEVSYLVLRSLGHSVLVQLLESLATGELPIEHHTLVDLARAAELLDKYADARVDFVDVVIVAMAERLNITRILTVDRRHFTLFRPTHCTTFELIP